MEYKNILIIKMSSLGDILHVLPSAAALRDRFPKAKISWLVHPQFASFVPGKPVIDEIIYFDKAAFKKMGILKKIKFIIKFRRELHDRNFDLVIDLQGLFKSALVASLTGTKEKIGYCEMRECSGLISRAIYGEHKDGHIIERYLDVVRSLGAEVKEIKYPMPNLTDEKRSVKEKLAKEVRNIPSYVVFIIATRWKSKDWSLSKFSELCDKIAEDGTYIVLAGGPADDVKANKVIEEAKTDKIINFTGKTSLLELGALIDDAKLLVGGDTGPLHIAAALNKPIVAIYGPTAPGRSAPYGSDNASLIASPLGDAELLKEKRYDTKYIDAITVDMVFDAYKKTIKVLDEEKDLKVEEYKEKAKEISKKRAESKKSKSKWKK